ncbi:hypothetical protein F2Q70_00026552 [Brassica cretica]|uniref:Uncharacterized protein n=1 Tax=Brassica cretica TaxID=69181 RepID=A0A8S9ICV2_BRACR|nr:hypothetical protein F2Q68_00026123 [Brassica cretica]KAF2604052.1 hypothetical protein F2Q70_00026552 [Brassica cretica]
MNQLGLNSKLMIPNLGEIILHLVFSISTLWSLGVVLELRITFITTIVLVVFSGVLVIGIYHLLIGRFEIEYFRRVTAVLCSLFGTFVWNLGWLCGLIGGVNNYWAAVTMLGWINVVFVFSLKKSGAYDLSFLEIESLTDASLPSVMFIGNGWTLQASAFPFSGVEVV